MAQDVLIQNDFEGLKLYEPDTEIHSVVGAKLRAVFDKLFRNTEIDSKDFYFTVFHDEQPNAFFIRKDKTLNGKNVIAVSDSVVAALDSEEELAAIIAHECGHYLWAQYIQGRNTIVQERWSDIYSVDLMINAGYNPRYILTMQKKILNDFRVQNISLDVHGTSFARAEDVKAYLTKIASERGDFPELNADKYSSAAWRVFQKDVKELESKNPYYTYVERLLRGRFGTTNINKINRLDFVNLIIEEFESGNLSYADSYGRSVRMGEFVRLYTGYVFEGDKTEEETLALQKLFLLAHEKFGRYAHDILRMAKLQEFGPFVQQRKNIEGFIKNYDDKEQAIFWADEMGRLMWTVDYFSYLDGIEKNPYPSLNPLGQDNIGKPFPWVRLEGYDNYRVRWALYRLYDKDRTHYSLPIYDSEDYFLENGIVTKFGEDARRENERVENAEEYEREKICFEELKKEVERIDVFYNMIADYHAGLISDELFYDYFKEEKPSNSSFIDKLNVDIAYARYSKNSYFRDDLYALYQQILNSRWYRYFGTKFGRHEMLIADKFETNLEELQEVIKRLVKGSFDYECYSKMCEAQYRFASYLNKQVDDDMKQMYAFGLLHDLYAWHWHNDNREEYFVRQARQYQKMSLIGVSNNTRLFDNMREWFLDAIAENFEYNEDSILMKNAVRQLIGRDKISNEADLISVLQKLRSWQDGSRCLPMFAVFVWVDYLRHGGRANIAAVLDNMSMVKSNKYVVLNDMLAQYIGWDDFMILGLHDKIRFYEFFKYNNLFSEKFANQNKVIENIVDEIVSRPVNDKDAVNYAHNFLAKMPNSMFGEEVRYDIRDFEFANERNKLIDFYAAHWADRLGPDNGTEKYLNDLNLFVQDIDKENPSTHKPAFSRTIKKGVANALSNKVVSQARAAEMLGRVGEESVSGTQVEKYDYMIRGAEAAFAYLAYKPKDAVACINFLAKKLSDKSMDDVIRIIQKNHENAIGYTNKYLNKEQLTILHQAFWSADLPARAYIMNRLLNSYSQNDEQKLNMVLDMYFDKKSEYYNDANLVITNVYKNLQDYERNLILAALASAGQRDENDQTTGGQMVGQGLRMFFQAKGSAFIKFGQLLSYLPQLDSDIRVELARLRDKANIPTRDELFRMMEQSLPKSVMEDVSHVGDILGAGSFYVTVRVVYKGRECVLSVMRPYAHDLTESGLDMISRTIDDLVKVDSKYKPLKNIVNQARESSMSELDIEQDFQKYKRAKTQYERISVDVNGTKYSPDVATWLSYGSVANGENAYKIMDEAAGKSLTSDAWTEQDRHELAVAYVTLELCLLLSGVQWDTDRHMGQQNFYNSSFRDVVIGIFDTGAQMNKAPNKKDKMMLGHLLYELAAGISNGLSVGDVLVRVIKGVDNMAGTFNLDTAYIDGVQRGLTALSDIMEYQKEVKDDNGNVILSAKRLGAQDWQNIVMAIYKSGIVDKTVKKTVVAKAIVDKLLMFGRGIKLGVPAAGDNPIVVEYIPVDKKYLVAEKMRKGQEELRELMNKRQGNERFGMKFVLRDISTQGNGGAFA